MKILDRILRAGEGKKLKALEGLVPEINALSTSIGALSDDALRGKTAEFRQRVERGETLDDLLIEAFAVTREAADRVIGQRHFDVQMMGGAALHFGWVSEMKTGEGKTLVSTLPVYLNALGGKGVHLITVNDYLARFHAEWMGRIHKFLGLEVGLVIPGFKERPAEKRQAYAADVTYGTNNEFGFDYLRDNMAMTREEQVPAGASTTPSSTRSTRSSSTRPARRSSSAVSSPTPRSSTTASRRSSAGLKRDVDYEVDEEKRIGRRPSKSGIEKVEKALAIENMYDDVSVRTSCTSCTVALKAKELYKRDKDYIIQVRRGEDRRRVHRSRARGSSLERRHPPGGRGQGGRQDQGREPDARHDHAAELLPHVRQAGRHDGHGLRPRLPS